MNANPKFLAATAHVDDAAIQPLPSSRKIHVGNLKVPMREISQSADNPPIYVYDTSDRKSTRLNSSHLVISYAVFCLKKKTTYHFLFTRLPPAPASISTPDALDTVSQFQSQDSCEQTLYAFLLTSPASHPTLATDAF